jgi:hypothetical protein
MAPSEAQGIFLFISRSNHKLELTAAMREIVRPRSSA